MKNQFPISCAKAVLPAVAIVLFFASADCTLGQSPEVKPLRVACIGDSITYGAGIPNAADHYPEQLGKLLGVKWEVRNFGQNGACVRKKGERPYLNLPTLKAPLAFAPDVVVFMLGVNDLSTLTPETILEFETDYQELIAPFTILPAKPRIFLCYPTPYGGEVAQKMERDVIRKLAEKNGCGLIDLNAPLRDKPDLFPDHCHPNAAGAAIMAQEVYKVLTDPK